MYTVNIFKPFYVLLNETSLFTWINKFSLDSDSIRLCIVIRLFCLHLTWPNLGQCTLIVECTNSKSCYAD
jgi:hypothetical protein